MKRYVFSRNRDKSNDLKVQQATKTMIDGQIFHQKVITKYKYESKPEGGLLHFFRKSFELV